jgi:phosphoribosylanthranilate isomerase
VAEVKFCGLTREEDAAFAASLGATHAGVIFAGGPRELRPEVARDVHDAAGGSVRRVGVFGADFRTRIGVVTTVAPLDVVQLHADPTPADVLAVRQLFDGEVWATVRVPAASLPDGIAALFGVADAILLDARVPGKLGGAGVTLPWAQLAEAVSRIRSGGRLVLAGGLRPENVEEAVAAIKPDIADVSSGVESAPGIKDHARMEAFVRAATGSVE